MKIVLVSGIFPPDVGGPATYVPLIASELVERGHALTVITLSDVEDDELVRPYRLIRIRRSTSRLKRMVKTIALIVRESRAADVLFAVGLHFECGIGSLIARKSLVARVGGDIAWEQAINRGLVEDPFHHFQSKAYGWRVGLLRAMRNWPLRRARAVVANSIYMAGQVQHWGIPSDRTQVILNAVDIPASIQPNRLLDRTTFCVVSAGRFVPWKRFEGIVDAIGQLDNAGLILIGDGPRREAVERHVRDLGLAQRVIFLGSRTHEETLAFLAAGDAFVLNSEWEGLPHVVLEAMSLGLPVVATHTEGTASIVRDGVTGILIAINGQDLAGVLIQLQADAEWRHKLGAAAKREACERFGKRKMVDETEALLQSCGS